MDDESLGGGDGEKRGSSSPPGSRDARIEAVLTEFIQAVEAGDRPDREQLLEQHPDIRDELAEYFGDHERLLRVRRCLSTDDAVAEGQGFAFPSGSPPDIPDHELEEQIGLGGMGVVYRARQRSLDRVVAVKMIVAGFFAREEDIRRFLFEAEAAARLQHPNIVPIYELGRSGSCHYFTMRHFVGGNLAQRISRFPARPDEGAKLVETIARAVHYAHERGVLHRDLKPSNIFLDEHDEPYVGDFGLARRIDDESDLTQTGAIVGTPSYASPEQAMGKADRVTTATDTYSLGAVLYELLTGRPPFKADSSTATFRMVVELAPPPPSLVRPAVPKDLETICLKCLRKESGQRYATAADLADDLDRYLQGKPIHARPVSAWERGVLWARRRPGLAAMVAVSTVAVLLLLVVTIVSNRWLSEAAEQAQRRADEALRSAFASRLSQAFTALRDAHVAVARRHLSSLEPREGETDLTSFDSRLLATMSDQVRWKRRSRWAEMFTCLAVSHDAKLLVSASKPGFELWDPHTGEARGTLPAGASGGQCAAFSPDGALLVLAMRDSSLDFYALPELRRLATIQNNGSVPRRLRFHTDSRQLVMAGDQFTQVIDAADFSVQKTRLKPANAAVFTPDGQAVILGGPDTSVRLWSLTSDEPERAFDHHAMNVLDLALSPDGRWLATSSDDRTIKIWERESLAVRAVFIGHEVRVRSVVFSPDGELLLSASDDRSVKLWKFATDQKSSAPPVTYLGHEFGATRALFVPGSGTIVSTGADGTIHAWNLPASRPDCGGWPADVPYGDVVRFRPDGKRLVTVSARGTVAVWETPPVQPVREPRLLARFDVDLGEDSVWNVSRDAGLLVVARDVEGKPGDEIEVRDLLGQRELARWIVEGEAVIALEPSADGTKLVASTVNRRALLWELRRDGESLAVAPASTFELPSAEMQYIALSPDGRTVAFSEIGPVLAIHDIASGRQQVWGDANEGRVFALAFSEDSRRLAVAGEDRIVRVWSHSGDAQTPSAPWELALRLEGHGSAVAALAFSDDGKVLASGSDDSTVRFWDLETGAERASLFGYAGTVDGLVFSPDGAQLASYGGLSGSGLDWGEIRVWATTPARGQANDQKE